MDNDNKNLKEVGLIKSVLTSEVKYFIGVILFIGGVASPFYAMKQDIALMKADIANINANHEVHIQDLTQEIKALQTQQVDLQKQIIAIISTRK